MLNLLSNVFILYLFYSLNNLHSWDGLYVAWTYGLKNLCNEWTNSTRLNTVVIFELLTGYISPFWLSNYVMLLPYIHATFKAERKLQTSFCSL
jgi:hypothetical protein